MAKHFKCGLKIKKKKIFAKKLFIYYSTTFTTHPDLDGGDEVEDVMVASKLTCFTCEIHTNAALG